MHLLLEIFQYILKETILIENYNFINNQNKNRHVIYAHIT